MTSQEFGIINYLDKHEIHKGNHQMQSVIINSFCIERGVDNDSNWSEKVNCVNRHFGLFCQYANNNWK